jgi:hypothetical protein
MVFTVAVPPKFERRRLLRAAAALAGASGVGGLLAGCDLSGLVGGGEPRPMPAVDRDALRSVAADALGLATRYDAAIGQHADQASRLRAIRDAHRAHADAVNRSLASEAQPTAAQAASAAASGPSGTGLADLAAAERAAAERATAVCLQVQTYHAPLIGTIAAARASHAEALT